MNFASFVSAVHGAPGTVWLGYHLAGRTASSGATIDALRLDTNRRLLIRRSGEQFKLFPPI
jgi:hypothetical protein